MSFSKGKTIVWMIWIIASIFYAYQYVLRVMPSIMMNNIMQAFHIDLLAFGQFSGIYYIGYSLMHLPIGIMLDRFGPRKVMTGCILLTVAGLAPLIFSNYWVYPIIGRLLIGVGSSAAILGVFKIIRMTFSEKRFPRMLSFSVTIGLIGAIYGGGPVSLMLERYGFQRVLYAFIFAGLALACATYWIIPDQKGAQQESVLSDIKEVLTDWRVIGSCIFAGLMVGPLEGFADVWGAPFLKGTYGFDTTLSASLPSLIFIGMCFGSPVLNFVAERLGYLRTIIGSGVIMALAFILMLIYPCSPTVFSVLFVIVGICSSYQILAIYKVSTFVRERVAGLATAVANMIIMIFGYAFHTAISTVIDWMGGADSSKALKYGMLVIPLALLMGAAGFVVLKLKNGNRAEKLYN